MARTRANLVVDALALTAFTAVASTGLVLHWLLPAGSGRWESAGCSGAAEVLVVWGWSRHEWGLVHTWAAWALMATLAVHLALHARWIQITVARQAPAGSVRRALLGVMALVWLLLAAFPLLGRPQAVSRPQPQAEGQSLYERECQRCHGAAAQLPLLPEDPQAARALLRQAQPAAAHARLRGLTEAQLASLVDYVAKARAPR